MSRYLDPKNDIAFKKLFATEEHKPLLISMLNGLLQLDGERRIKSVEFLPTEQVPKAIDWKKTILDVKCTDQLDNQYIVEMQNRKFPNFKKRSQFYAADQYTRGLPSGVDYIKLAPVILVMISDQVLFDEKVSYISHHRTLDTKTFENDLGEISYVFVELPKFQKTEDELKTLEDKWLYFFKNSGVLREVPKNMQEPELLEAFKCLEEYSWTVPEYDAYRGIAMAIMDDRDIMRGLMEQILEGTKKGQAEGKAEGKAEGETAGKLETAKNLLAMGLSLKDIAKATGFTEAFLKKQFRK